MKKISVKVIHKEEPHSIFGIWTTSNDRTVAKDIPAVAKKYYDITGKKQGEVLPFFVVSKNYKVATRDFDLFLGGLSRQKEFNNDENPEKLANFEEFILPKGDYGVMVVKPKFGLNFFWGFAIGNAKRFFYRTWLPQSGYISHNLEYEYHTQKSLGKNPEIEIFFSIKPNF